MRVSTRLALGLGVLMALFTAVVVYQLVTIDRTVEATRQMASVSSRLLLTATEQGHRLSQLEENAAKYAITGDPGYAARYGSVALQVGSTLDSLRGLDLRGDEARAVERLDSAWIELRDVLSADSVVAGTPVASGAEPELQVERIRTALESLRRLSGEVGEAARASMLARVSESERRADRAARASLFAAVGALVVGFLVSVLLLRFISRSLDRLTRGTRAVAGGDLSYRIREGGQGEFGRLAEDFNEMTVRLEELDRMKRDFLSMVSHDLKSPLASIQETHRAILDGLTGDVTDRQRRMLRRAVGHGERLSGMISKLLDLSRMEAGEIQFSLEPSDLRETVRSAMDALGPRVEESGARLERDLPDTPLIVPHDVEFMRRVVENVVENALRYSPADAPVRLTVRPVERGEVAASAAARDAFEGAGRAALLEIRDAGPGVAEEDRERIFERFVRGRRQPDGDGGKRRGGVGLGLALCRKVVRAHGGEIWVEQAEHASGGGSVFRILLPATRWELGEANGDGASGSRAPAEQRSTSSSGTGAGRPG